MLGCDVHLEYMHSVIPRRLTPSPSSPSVMTSRQMHPESADLVRMITSGVPVRKPYEGGDLEEFRRMFSGGTKQFTGEFNYSGERSEIIVPTSGGGVPVYVYAPDQAGETPPVLVYLHGGGLVLGSRDGVDTMCRMISQHAQCIILNVEYRLAPESPFPSFIDDACDVTKWALTNKNQYGASAGSAVGVGGDSAGSQLAASVCHSVQGLAFQLLIYPRVTPPRDYTLPSYIEHKEDYILPRKFIEWFDEMYCPEGEECNVRIASLLQPASSFLRLPPALILPAHIDPLRSDSYEYHKKLQDAGVSSELHEIQGSIHGFYTRPGHYKQLTEEAYKLTTDFIKKYGGCQ